MRIQKDVVMFTFQRNMCKIHQTLHFISLKKKKKKTQIDKRALAGSDPTSSINVFILSPAANAFQCQR